MEKISKYSIIDSAPTVTSNHSCMSLQWKRAENNTRCTAAREKVHLKIKMLEPRSLLEEIRRLMKGLRCPEGKTLPRKTFFHLWKRPMKFCAPKKQMKVSCDGYVSKEMQSYSMVKERLRPDNVWQGSACMEILRGQKALRGHYVKLLNMKPGLCWSPPHRQDVRRARALGHLPRRAAR